MSDVYKNRSIVLANNAQTVVYTVPTADASTQPPQKPVQAVVKSIRICNVSGGAVTATVVNADSSVGSDINITNVLSIAVIPVPGVGVVGGVYGSSEPIPPPPPPHAVIKNKPNKTVTFLKVFILSPNSFYCRASIKCKKGLCPNQPSLWQSDFM